jgi:UDP-glucose 4-epimerase
MAALLKLAQLAVPLPLGGLSGRRSLLSVENLVEAIDVVLRADGPLRRPFILADPDPLTIPEMVAALREGLGRRPGLIPVPPVLLRHALGLFGHGEAYERLGASLVASPKALTDLGWRPPVATRDGLIALARDSLLKRDEGEASKATHETA